MPEFEQTISVADFETHGSHLYSNAQCVDCLVNIPVTTTSVKCVMDRISYSLKLFKFKDEVTYIPESTT